jgi:hypothetical protein
MRILRLLLAAGIAILFAMGPARAQEDYCARLRADLAALGGGRAPGNEVGGSAREADDLRRRIRAAQDRSRAEGCSGGFLGELFGNRRGAPPGLCAAIRSDIARMERQLARLRAPARRWAPRWESDSFRQQDAAAIRRRMEEAGCNTQTARGGGPNWGPYRTVCVRACDGFFFPISSSASRREFDQHARACQALCPGQEVSLYYFGVGEDDPARAVSLTGDRYSTLPNAFAYRDSFNPTCGCAPEGGWASVASHYSRAYPTGMLAPSSTVERTSLGIPVPRVKPAASDDPETLANRLGGFEVEPVAPSGEAEVASRGDQEIRLIGPAFYYAN